MSRRYLEPAAEVTALRDALQITQAELARRLGVTRRSVIRGEQRGLEIPSVYDNSPRASVGEKWRALKIEARAALEKRAAAAKAEARRRGNREAARRYRRKAARATRVTHSPRSRAKSHAKKRPKSDRFRKIPRKVSPRQAGRRRGRK